MRHEICRKKTFKNQIKFFLSALIAPTLALLGLAVLCLGRALLSPAADISAPTLDLTVPLSMPLLEQTQTPADQPAFWDQSVTLQVQLGDEVREMTLGDYLWGVVAAEMPASFEQEALNAQACAARTYTVYKLLHPTAAHEADLCDNTGCCQAWMSREERMAAWGERRDSLAEKITLAVESTDGWAVCYGNAPLQAVFHAASGEVTRSAEAAWGTDVPYLQSVNSPEGEEVPNYYSVVNVSAADFAAALPECHLSGDCAGWIGEINYDSSGLSESVVIGDAEVKTTRLRSLFSLRSSNLSVEAGGDTITFHVTGYGHGVGMSQYGANALAKQGYTWQEILTWYYSGASVEKLADKSLDLG